jgi:hypothetical protein
MFVSSVEYRIVKDAKDLWHDGRCLELPCMPLSFLTKTATLLRVVQEVVKCRG